MTITVEAVPALQMSNFFEDDERIPPQPACEKNCHMAPRAAYCDGGHPLHVRIPPVEHVQEFLRSGGNLPWLVRALRRFGFHVMHSKRGTETITFTPTFITKFIQRKLYLGKPRQNTVAVQRGGVMQLAGCEYSHVRGNRNFQKVLRDIWDVYEKGSTEDDVEQDIVQQVADFMRSYIAEHSPIYVVRRENLRGLKLRGIFMINTETNERVPIDPGEHRDEKKFPRTPQAVADRVIGHWLYMKLIKKRDRGSCQTRDLSDDKLQEIVTAHKKNVELENRKAAAPEDDDDDDGTALEDELLAPSDSASSCSDYSSSPRRSKKKSSKGHKSRKSHKSRKAHKASSSASGKRTRLRGG